MDLRHEQGRLCGGMESIGYSFREESLLETLTQDVVKTSAIEGEFLDQTLVRSSVARHLGIEIAGLNKIDRHVEGVVEMVLDATQQFDEPVTKTRLFRWHASLFPTGNSGFQKIKIGKWRRGIVQVVSGSMGKEKIHFEGPPAAQVPKEMTLFLKWLNKDNHLDPLVKTALAHLWFVTIHPFDDGNGRIGRAIADLLLTRSEKIPTRFYSLSAQIQKERKEYYHILEKTQKGDLNVTPWLVWFLGCLSRSIMQALSTLDAAQYKARFWQSLSGITLNQRQSKMLKRLLEGFKGKLTSSKWAKITKCSQDTAYRDIQELLNLGILEKGTEGGRSTNYHLGRKE